MGNQIECCRIPTNLGKKDIKTYRGVKPRTNPNFPSSNSKDFDNFGSFKKPNNSDKNSNKKGNSYLNSVYGNENESKFPNFAEFDIEPVSEPLYQEQISQPQQKYETGNAQYIETNPAIQTTNYVTSTNQYSPPEIQTNTAQYIQSEFNLNNYEQNSQNVQTNYINSNPQEYTSNMNINSNPQEYTSNMNINSNTQEYTSNVNINNQPVEYISSTTSENILNQYDSTHKILPTKYIQIQKPVIYANNNIQYQSASEYTKSPVTNYVESTSSNQQYEQYNFTNSTPQYYETKNINYIPSKIENVYNPTNQYIEEISSPKTNEIQYSNYQSQTSYVENPQQIYMEQKPSQIYIEPKAKIQSQVYSQQSNNYNENEVYRGKVNKKEKFPSDSGKKKPKKLKKKRKIIEYYSEDDEEEEESDDPEENEDEQNSSDNEEIEEEKPKYKKLKNKNKHKKIQIIKKKKKSKNPKKQIIKATEDKENESDNIEFDQNTRNNNNINKNKIILKNLNLKKEIPKDDEEEFSGFQKEPELSRGSFDNSINNFEDIYSNKNKVDLKSNNKKDDEQVISLKNGSKIVGNFKKEEIVENRNEIAEKERNELFQGKTLKIASVEKKEETTGCQVPEFISNIFSKIF